MATEVWEMLLRLWSRRAQSLAGAFEVLYLVIHVRHELR